jgi:hypothetical protein
MYENGKMRPAKTKEWGMTTKENYGGILTKIYHKHFCKCQNVLVQQYDNKKVMMSSRFIDRVSRKVAARG